MKQIVLCVFFMALMPLCWGQKKQNIQQLLKAEVDPRVELLGIMARMAGLGGYDSKAYKLYINDVDKHFAKDSLHPAILHLKELKRKHYLGFDAVMRMAIHLDYPSLKPKVAFSSEIPEKRWTREGAEKFIPLVQKFARDTRFDDFYKAHKDVYTIAEKRFQVLLEQADYDWFPKFYGYKPEGKFAVYLGMLNGNFSYGPKVEYPNNREEFYAIMANYKTDSEGLPVYDQSMLSTVVHEFNHSFINHLILNDTKSWESFGEKVHEQVQYEMQRNYYPHWTISMFESLVRAAVIRYEMEHGATGKEVATAITNEKKLGFYWIEDLVTLMGVYENNRIQYPNFASFMPVIKAYMSDLAQNMEFKYKAYAENIPKIVTITPFENGATGVDPSIKEVTIIFSKPMTGWSFGYSELGKDHYPIKSIDGWDETQTQLKLTLDLQPSKKYEMKLSNTNFRTKEDYSIKPVVFSFTTK